MNIREIAAMYPAIDVLGAVNTEDGINTLHFSSIFEMFDTITTLTVSFTDPTVEILINICRNATLEKIGDHHWNCVPSSKRDGSHQQSS